MARETRLPKEASPRAGGPGAGVFAHRFLFLLQAIVLLLMAVPVLDALRDRVPIRLAGIVLAALFVLVQLAAVYAVSRRRITIIVAVTLAAPLIAVQLLSLFLQGEGLRLAYHVLGIAFLGQSIAVVTRFLFERQRVTALMVSAAVCVYLMLGILWALAYSLIEMITPGAFAVGGDASASLGLTLHDPGASSRALYYSYVTLTTLGYGDVVPRTALAQAVATWEALVGQIYVTVLIARLVGLHVAGAGSGEDASNG